MPLLISRAVGSALSFGLTGASAGPPGAPTIGTATATGSSSATVSYTAPVNNGGKPITLYTAISTPGCKTGTLSQAGSGTITVNCLSPSTSYTFKVRAQNSIGYGSYSGNSNSITTSVVTGSQSFTTAGTFCWTAPAGVTSVSVVAIGGGGIGSSAALGYRNNYAVTPGNSYQVIVGNGGCPGNGPPGVPSRYGTSSFFVSGAVLRGGGGYCTFPASFATSGGSGGGHNGGNSGAPGYATGGGCIGINGSTCSAGGGGELFCDLNRWGLQCSGVAFGAGGGVGLFGSGSSGSAGSYRNVGNCLSSYAAGGGGGSGGGSGGNTTVNYSTSVSVAGVGGAYGGGTGLICINTTTRTYPRGAVGAVRIVWPGSTRQFPSTCVGSP